MQNIQQDGTNQIAEIADFGSVFLNIQQEKKQIKILNRTKPDNDFNNFLNGPPNQNSFRKEEYQKNYFTNNYQEQDGSTKIKHYEYNTSNQNSGRILLDANYEQDYYSNQNTADYSRYICEQTNQMSQEFCSGDIQYKNSGQIQNLEVQELTPINNINLQITMKFDERYYNYEECPHLVPVEYINQQLSKIDTNGCYIEQFAEDQSESQEPFESEVDPEMINQQQEATNENKNKNKKKTKRGNRKNKNKNTNQQQEDIKQQQCDQNQIDQQQQEIVSDLNSQSENGQFEELDDAVSEEFKKYITDFMESIENKKFSLTQTIYGTQTQQKSIKIIEIKNYESQIKELCQQFPHLKYSEIALSLQLIVNYENCQQFLQSLQFQENKPILREINQLLVYEQKAKDSGDKDELFKTQYQINEFKKTNKTVINEQQSLYETAIKIIELNNYKFDIKKCDQKTKEQKKLELEQNRVQVIEINDRKYNIIKQYQTCVINEQQCNQYLKQIRIEKQKLEKVGKNLFLDLMAIENGFCRIDFHKFYASEIEKILDGVFDKVESYKICNEVDSIKLQIIVGKGLHSKNKKPIIGPMTQQYIQQYLQQIVEIKEGKIDVIV